MLIFIQIPRPLTLTTCSDKRGELFQFVAQAADQAGAGFQGLRVVSCRSPAPADQFTVRKHLAFILHQDAQQPALGRGEVLDLVLMLDLTARKVHHGAVFQCEYLLPIIQLRRDCCTRVNAQRRDKPFLTLAMICAGEAGFIK
jgi:hypothetical protein